MKDGSEGHQCRFRFAPLLAQTMIHQIPCPTSAHSTGSHRGGFLGSDLPERCSAMLHATPLHHGRTTQKEPMRLRTEARRSSSDFLLCNLASGGANCVVRWVHKVDLSIQSLVLTTLPAPVESPAGTYLLAPPAFLAVSP